MKSKILLSLMAIAIAASFATPAPAQAQGAHPSVICGACRNPTLHPRDFRNFAYNQVFSPGGWMTYAQGDFFQVVNPAGQSVLVDMNMDISVFNFDLGIPIPLPFPIAVQVQIILIFENGDQIMSMIDPRAHPDGLPMPDGSDEGVGPGGGGSGGSSGGDSGGGSGGGPGGGPGGGSGGGPGGGSGGNDGGGDYGAPPGGRDSNRRCGITRVDGGPGRRTCI